MLTKSSIDFIKNKYSDQKDVDFISERCEDTYTNLLLPVLKEHGYNKEAFHLLIDMIIARIKENSAERLSQFSSPKVFEDLCETLDFVLKNEIDNME